MRLEAEQLEIGMTILTDQGPAEITWMGEQRDKYQPIAYRLADGREISDDETRYWTEFEVISQ